METEAGFEPGHWKELGELGWLAMDLPEDQGGAGYGFLEIAVVGEEMGRTLYPSPYLATVVMGASLVAAVGTPDQKAEILGGVAAGGQTLAVAFTEPGSD